jgi:hypothetical protein
MMEGIERRDHAIEGMASRGSSNLASLGNVIVGIEGRRTDAADPFPAGSTGCGFGGSGVSGTNGAVATRAADDSIGPPHRSHQISIPKLG